MKKLVVIGLALILLASCFAPAIAESEEWTCASCGAAATGNFCSKCGAKRPEIPLTWTRPKCGTKDIASKFCPECGAKRGE